MLFMMKPWMLPPPLVPFDFLVDFEQLPRAVRQKAEPWEQLMETPLGWPWGQA